MESGWACVRMRLGAMLNVTLGEIKRVDIPEVNAVGLDNKGQRKKNTLEAVKGCPLPLVACPLSLVACRLSLVTIFKGVTMFCEHHER